MERTRRAAASYSYYNDHWIPILRGMPLQMSSSSFSCPSPLPLLCPRTLLRPNFNSPLHPIIRSARLSALQLHGRWQKNLFDPFLLNQHLEQLFPSVRVLMLWINRRAFKSESGSDSSSCPSLGCPSIPSAADPSRALIIDALPILCPIWLLF